MQMKVWKGGFCLVRPPGSLQMHSGWAEGARTAVWRWRKDTNTFERIWRWRHHWTFGCKVQRINRCFVDENLGSSFRYFCIKPRLICLATPLSGPQPVGTWPNQSASSEEERGGSCVDASTWAVLSEMYVYRLFWQMRRSCVVTKLNSSGRN